MRLYELRDCLELKIEMLRKVSRKDTRHQESLAQFGQTSVLDKVRQMKQTILSVACIPPQRKQFILQMTYVMPCFVKRKKTVSPYYHQRQTVSTFTFRDAIIRRMFGEEP